MDAAVMVFRHFVTASTSVELKSAKVFLGHPLSAETDEEKAMIRFRRLPTYVGHLFEKTLERQLVGQLSKQ